MKLTDEQKEPVANAIRILVESSGPSYPEDLVALIEDEPAFDGMGFDDLIAIANQAFGNEVSDLSLRNSLMREYVQNLIACFDDARWQELVTLMAACRMFTTMPLRSFLENRPEDGDDYPLRHEGARHGKIVCSWDVGKGALRDGMSRIGFSSKGHYNKTRDCEILLYWPAVAGISKRRWAAVLDEIRLVLVEGTPENREFADDPSSHAVEIR